MKGAEEEAQGSVLAEDKGGMDDVEMAQNTAVMRKIKPVT